MWNTLTDNLPATIATLTGLAGLAAAWLRLHPRRLLGWLAAVRERETLRAMYDNEVAWGRYWKDQHDQCRDQLRERQP